MVATTTEADRGRLTYQPALDGLRAVAVMAVVLYHQHGGPGLGPIGRGGFLGVDVFFVLSGYLITALLLDEHVRTSTIALGRFWARRARRLFPALLVLLVLASVIGAFLDSAARRRSFLDDLPYVLAYVQNWHIVFGHPSIHASVGHTWSLAVEEQFYLVWPIVLFGLITLTRRRPRALVGIVAGLAAASAIWSGFGVNDLRAYFGTDARAHELLAGATLAVVGARFGRVVQERAGRSWNLLGVALLGVLVALLLGAPANAIGHNGGTAAFAVLTALVIAIAVQPASTARSLLSTPVLVRLGRISYGLYLFHFPVFQWIRPTADVSGIPLLLIRSFVTLVIAVASYVVVERPIRNGRLRWRVSVPLGAAIVAGVFAFTSVTAVAELAPPKSKVLGFALAQAAASAPAGSTRVLVIGGSRAALLNLDRPGATRVGRLWVIAVGMNGCGLTSQSHECRAVPDDVGALARAFRAPIVVLMPDEGDVLDASAANVSPSEQGRTTGRLDAMRRAVEGRQVGILTVPCPAGSTARTDAFNRTVISWARRHRVAVHPSAPVTCRAGAVPIASAAAVHESIAQLVAQIDREKK